MGALLSHFLSNVDNVYKYLYTRPVSEKPIFWVASSLDDVRSFPEDARRLAGHFLHLVQQGLEPPDLKPMVIVGQGVYEIRIHTRVEHRVFYLAKFSEGYRFGKATVQAVGQGTRQSTRSGIKGGGL